MSDQRKATEPADERRVEELLRVNAELSAEIRSLAAGRIAEPRSAVMPAARRFGRLTEDRDELAAELEQTRETLAALQAERDRLEEHNRELGLHVHELSREHHELAEKAQAQAQALATLRGGAGGFLRRLRARLLRRRRA